MAAVPNILCGHRGPRSQHIYLLYTKQDKKTTLEPKKFKEIPQSLISTSIPSEVQHSRKNVMHFSPITPRTEPLVTRTMLGTIRGNVCW